MSVDTASLASPWRTPAHAAEAVTPGRNVIRSVDVPLIVGGVIEGRVRMDGPAAPLTHPISILLLELKTGTRTVLESFSDGSFYRMGLPAGSSAATVEDHVLGPLSLRADTVHFELRPSASATDPGPAVSGIELVLRPAGREQANTGR